VFYESVYTQSLYPYQQQSVDRAISHPRLVRYAVTTERLSSDGQWRSSGLHLLFDGAGRSGTGSGGPTHPSYKHPPEFHCRSWLQSHRNAAGELCAQSGVIEARDEKASRLTKQQWSRDMENLASSSISSIKCQITTNVISMHFKDIIQFKPIRIQIIVIQS